MAFDASAARLMRSPFESSQKEFDFSDPFALLDDLKAPCSASMSGIGSVREYLSNAPLESSLNLDVGGKLHFHWANWAHTCGLQREIHAGNPARLDALEKNLASLKRIEIWLKSPKGVVITSLHELYESYLDPRLRVSLFGSSGNQLNEREILFSQTGEAGPFSRLTAMKWFDKNIYALFVFKKLLLGFVPQRQFRLGSSVNAVWWLNSSPLDAITTTVHQVSQHGILFKVDSRCNFQRLAHGSSENVIIHFPVGFLSPSDTPEQTIAILNQGETIALKLDGQQLVDDKVWLRGGASDESFFFIKAKTLLQERAPELVQASLSFEKWFQKELK